MTRWWTSRGCPAGRASRAGSSSRGGARLGGAAFEGGVPAEGEAAPLRGRTRTLRRGEDFDQVVLGIPVGALAGDLRRADGARRALPARHRVRRHRADPGLPALVEQDRGRARLGPRRELRGRLLRGAARHLLRHDPPDRPRVVAGGRAAPDDRLLLRRDRRPGGRDARRDRRTRPSATPSSSSSAICAALWPRARRGTASTGTC